VADHDEDEDEGPLASRWATWALVALNGSVFLAMVLAGASPLLATMGDITGAGAVDPVRVWNGEVWRLLTACFVHLGVWHLALNMWVLMQLGRVLERMIGGARLLLIYLSSGVFGFACSVATSAVPTAGASGAVFGVTGALLALALLSRHRELGKILFEALMPFVAATLVLGYLVRMVDNSAHIGGLVFGFLLGLGLTAGDRSFLGDDDIRAPRVSAREKVAGVVALVASGVLFAVVVAYSGRPVLSPRYQVKAGLEDIMGHRLDSAKAHAAAAARLAPEDGVTFVLLGRVQMETATTDEEKKNAARVLKEGLTRLAGNDDLSDALLKAQVELALLGGGTEDLPFNDTRTVDAICDAALEILHDKGDVEAPIVKNECAWVKLKSPDPSVHDAATALVLARDAVKESAGKDASIQHTLAEALAQNGDPAEGLNILEKLAAEGRASELPGGDDFLASERRRLKRLVDDAKPPAVELP
jgi:rhomboid protease GluP